MLIGRADVCGRIERLLADARAGQSGVLVIRGEPGIERISAALPDALDLLAVTVEAGLGFDAAIAKLVDAFEGPLAEEFGRTLGEIRIGETRQDALKKLADRVGTPEFASFTRAVIQADQYGSSLGKILHVRRSRSSFPRCSSSSSGRRS